MKYFKLIKRDMKKKKLIGYNLKKDYIYFEKAAIEICKSQGSTEIEDFESNGYVAISESCPATKWLKNAGVLNLWFDPVYEEEKNLTFGNNKVTLEKVCSGIKIICGDEAGTLSQMEQIYKFATVEKNKYKFGSQLLKNIEYDDDTSWNIKHSQQPTELTIGCTTGTWEEFMEILTEAKKLNKC